MHHVCVPNSNFFSRVALMTRGQVKEGCDVVTVVKQGGGGLIKVRERGDCDVPRRATSLLIDAAEREIFVRVPFHL